MQQKYRGCESCAFHSSTTLGRARVPLVFAPTAHHPTALLVSSKQNRTKHTIIRAASVCDRGGVFCGGELLPEKWEPQRSPLLGLGWHSPSVATSQAGLATLPYALQVGTETLEGASHAVPCRTGQFPTPCCRADSLFHLLLNWRKKKISSFKIEIMTGEPVVLASVR